MIMEPFDLLNLHYGLIIVGWHLKAVTFAKFVWASPPHLLFCEGVIFYPSSVAWIFYIIFELPLRYIWFLGV